MQYHTDPKRTPPSLAVTAREFVPKLPRPNEQPKALLRVGATQFVPNTKANNNHVATTEQKKLSNSATEVAPASNSDGQPAARSLSIVANESTCSSRATNKSTLQKLHPEAMVFNPHIKVQLSSMKASPSLKDNADNFQPNLPEDLVDKGSDTQRGHNTMSTLNLEPREPTTATPRAPTSTHILSNTTAQIIPHDNGNDQPVTQSLSVGPNEFVPSSKVNNNKLSKLRLHPEAKEFNPQNKDQMTDTKASPSLRAGANAFQPNPPKCLVYKGTGSASALNPQSKVYSPSQDQQSYSKAQHNMKVLDASAKCFSPIAFTPGERLHASLGEKKKPLCRFFQQGACRHGLQCSFSHEMNQRPTIDCGGLALFAATQQTEDEDELHVVDEGIRCLFGAGAKVIELQLGPNEAANVQGSKRVLISGLTAQTNDFDLEARLSTIGGISAIHRNQESYAYCTFETSEHAANAASTLNGAPQATWSGLAGTAASADESTKKKGKQRGKKRERNSGFVTVVLVSETGPAMPSSRNATVKLQWYAPSRVAWLHFQKRSHAELAARACQGKRFDGRTVSCKFQLPRFNQTCSFSVWVGGLAEAVNKGHLSQFVAKHARGVKPESIQLEKPPFHDKDGAQVVRSLLLSKGGLLVQFDEDKDSRAQNLKRRALAKFANVEDAANACAYFRGTDRVPGLGGTKVHCQRVFSAKFTLPTYIFVLVQDGCTNAIQDSLQGPSQAPDIRFKVFHNPNATSSLLVQADDAKKLSRTRNQISDIVDGELLLDPCCKQEQKIPLWKHFFASRETTTTVTEKVFARFGYSVAVLFRKRRREVRIFTKTSLKREARDFVADLLASLKPQANAAPISPDQYKFLLTGGRDALDALIASCHATVSLDLKHRALLVEGSPSDSKRAVACLSKIMCRETSSDPKEDEEEPCPVCFCDPDEDDDDGGPAVELNCSHRYCRECFHAWLCGGRQSCTFPIQCLASGCSKPVRVGKLLPRAEFLSLLRSAVDDHVLSNLSKYQFCCAAGCGGIYALPDDSSSRTAICSTCQMTICCACKVQDHEGLTCEQYKIAKLPPDRLRNHIVEEILTLKCPRCSCAFLDFDGCFALTCSSCKCGFCGWCLKDCGSDAHSHVKSCTAKPREACNDTYFGTKEQFQSTQRKRRRQELVKFLRRLDTVDEQRAALKSIFQDLKDIGLTDVTVHSIAAS